MHVQWECVVPYQIGELCLRLWQVVGRWFPQPIFLYPFPQFAVLPQPTVGHLALTTDVNVEKPVVGVNQCQKGDAVEVFVVKKQRPALLWLLHLDMFPVQGPDAMRKIPSALIRALHIPPLLCCLRSLKEISMAISGITMGFFLSADSLALSFIFLNLIGTACQNVTFRKYVTFLYTVYIDITYT